MAVINNVDASDPCSLAKRTVLLVGGVELAAAGKFHDCEDTAGERTGDRTTRVVVVAKDGD